VHEESNNIVFPTGFSWKLGEGNLGEVPGQDYGNWLRGDIEHYRPWHSGYVLVSALYGSWHFVVINHPRELVAESLINRKNMTASWRHYSRVMIWAKQYKYGFLFGRPVYFSNIIIQTWEHTGISYLVQYKSKIIPVPKSGQLVFLNQNYRPYYYLQENSVCVYLPEQCNPITAGRPRKTDLPGRHTKVLNFPQNRWIIDSESAPPELAQQSAKHVPTKRAVIKFLLCQSQNELIK
jgi:hypothetical protein